MCSQQPVALSSAQSTQSTAFLRTAASGPCVSPVRDMDSEIVPSAALYHPRVSQYEASLIFTLYLIYHSTCQIILLSYHNTNLTLFLSTNNAMNSPSKHAGLQKARLLGSLSPEAIAAPNAGIPPSLCPSYRPTAVCFLQDTFLPFAALTVGSSCSLIPHRLPHTLVVTTMASVRSFPTIAKVRSFIISGVGSGRFQWQYFSWTVPDSEQAATITMSKAATGMFSSSPPDSAQIATSSPA